MMKRSLFFVFLSLFALTAPVFADRYLEECPCGPDSVKGPLRLLIMQGHRGADFRDSCRKHDLCYDTYGCPQGDCDEVFLVDLLRECEKSKRPKMARFKAKLFYWAVSKGGKKSYESAQKLAAGKLALAQK